MDQDKILDYYEKTWPAFVKLWKVDETLSIHHGYYEKGIYTHVQAVLNMNDFVGRILNLNSTSNKGKMILDAGCGIGGTVIYLARKYPHIDFKGINIIRQHIEQAKKHAKNNHVDSNTEFFLRDYLNTGFPPNYFEAAFALESVTYTSKIEDFVREMYRILKPKGLHPVMDN